MFKRVTLFRFFGFDIKADASWFFIAILVGWSFSEKVFPNLYPGQGDTTYQLMALATLAGVILSIIAHEVAHALVAEYYHMPVTAIVVFIFGGIAEMKGEPSHPKGEFLMAIAGPFMSVIMGLLFYAWAEMGGMTIGDGAAYHVLRYLGFLNLLVAGYNMIPAFPLDGGRALRALLWKRKRNFVLATRIAADVGQLFAYTLLVYACWRIVEHDDLFSGMWSGIFAFFMHAASTSSVKQTESQALLGVEKVSRFMTAQVITVPASLTIQDFVEEYVHKHYQRSFPVVENGQCEGVITLHSVLSLDRSKWHWLHVGSVMEPLGPKNSIDPHVSAAEALSLMQDSGRDVLIVAEENKFLGIIAWRDLAAYLSITMKIDHNAPVLSSR